MSTRLLTWAVLGLAFVCLGIAACAEAPVEPDPSALLTDAPALLMNGNGVVASVTGIGRPQGTRFYTVDARRMKDGTATGWFHANTVGKGGARVRVAVNCLHVNGNRAWGGGVIVAAVNPANIGLPFAFRVIDNGEGAGAPPDEIQTVWGFLDCTTEWPSSTRLIAVGNLQVRG
jgi:hypothetical protein